MKRAEIVAAARAWQGTPYRPGGHSKTGADCVGVLGGLGREFGILPENFEWPAYGQRGDGRMIPLLDRHLVRIPPAAIGDGSILIFDWAATRRAQHAGIATDWTRRVYLHAHRLRAEICETVYNPAGTRMRLVRAYDFPGVE